MLDQIRRISQLDPGELRRIGHTLSGRERSGFTGFLGTFGSRIASLLPVIENLSSFAPLVSNALRFVSSVGLKNEDAEREVNDDSLPTNTTALNNAFDNDYNPIETTMEERESSKPWRQPRPESLPQNQLPAQAFRKPRHE